MAGNNIEDLYKDIEQKATERIVAMRQLVDYAKKQGVAHASVGRFDKTLEPAIAVLKEIRETNEKLAELRGRKKPDEKRIARLEEKLIGLEKEFRAKEEIFSEHARSVAGELHGSEFREQKEHAKDFLSRMENLAKESILLDEEKDEFLKQRPSQKGAEPSKRRDEELEAEKKAKAVTWVPSWVHSHNMGADLSQVDWKQLEAYVKNDIRGTYEKTESYANISLPNKSTLSWDLKNNTLLISSFDEDTLTSTAKMLKASGVQSVDLSKMDQKFKPLAWKTATGEGLKVVGYTPSKEEAETLAPSTSRPAPK